MSLAAGPARISLRLTIAAAVAVLAPGPVAAQPDPDELVVQARQAMVNLDYDRAIRLLERAEEAGRSRRDQLATIYRSLGESRAALGDDDAAATEFRRLLALDPDAELPRGSSPKVTAPFESARAFMRQHRPLAVGCAREGRGAVLAIQSDPLSLIASARLTTADGTVLARARRGSGRARLSLAAPAGAPQEVACTALDVYGNELARTPIGTTDRAAPGGDETLDPTTILTPSHQRPRPPPRRSRVASGDSGASDTDTGQESTVSVGRTPEREPPPIYARWWLWGTGALVGAGATAFFAVQLQADEDDWRAIKRASQEHTYAEALAVQDRGERHALYANIATMTTAALAAVSLGLLVRDLVRDDDGPAAQIGAAPLPGGGAATFRVSF
jgi:tetratricopeptide (TPR) repeat protein